MAEYGPNLYGDELTFYGARPSSDLSANPMVAKVYNHGYVDLTWRYPKIAIDSFRIVRNQTGHPIHEDDGVILLSQDTLPEGSGAANSLVDGADHPLDTGRYAYYSAFAQLSGAWRRVGKTQVLVPGRPADARINRGTSEDPIYLDTSYPLQDALLDLVPRVFTNTRRDSIGPHDRTSPLRDFLAGLTMTPEEIRTLADLILPSASKANLPPGLLQPAMLQFGLPERTPLPIIDQKRLLREAHSVAQSRGTARGLVNYIESLTGWAPEVSLTSNLLRYANSSTFANGTGEWGLYFSSSYNLLTTNQRDAETDTTGFAAYGSPAATISSSTTYAYTGTKSIKVVAPTGPSSYGVTTYPVKAAATAGNRYFGRVRVRTAETKSTYMHLSLVWWTSGDGWITSTSGSDVAVTSADGWTELTVTGTAPATTAKVALAVIRDAVTAVAGDTFYVDGLELVQGGTELVDCTTWQPPNTGNYPLTTACKVSGQEGRLEIPEGGWTSPSSPRFFPVKPNTTYTVSTYFRPTDQATNSVAKTVTMRARGFQRVTDSVHQSEWPDRLPQDYIFGDGEWRIDDPMFWPRGKTAGTFPLDTGTASWTRRSITFKTGPTVNFVSIAIEWAGVSSDSWVFTGVALEEAGTAGTYRYPNSAAVTVAPTRTNLVSNPSFPSGITEGWWYTNGGGLTNDFGSSWPSLKPPGVPVSKSLEITREGGGPWTISHNLPTMSESVETSITASVYVLGAIDSSVTLGLSANGLDAAESTLTFTPVTSSIVSVSIDGGVMTVHTSSPHGFSVGDTAIIAGIPLINGTVTIDRVVSSTVFTAASAVPPTILNPDDCRDGTVAVDSSMATEWVRMFVTLTLPAGEWTPTLYMTSDSLFSVFVAGFLAERGTILVGDYFDGDSPGQYGAEWRGQAGLSLSDMYRGRVMMSVLLSETLHDHVPRHVGVQVTTLGGTVIADVPPSA